MNNVGLFCEEAHVYESVYMNTITEALDRMLLSVRTFYSIMSEYCIRKETR